MAYRLYPDRARALRQIERHAEERTPPERWAVELSEQQAQAIREFPERFAQILEAFIADAAEAADELGRRLATLAVA